MNAWEWSTHRPIIQLALQYFGPEYILELGIGNHSTPLFYSHGVPMMCIETDTEWIKTMKSKLPFLSVDHHKLPAGIGPFTRVHEINEQQRVEIQQYYSDLLTVCEGIKHYPKLLFVDQFNCGRTISINTLHSAFDIIIYHDAQPDGIAWHNYYFDQALQSNFNHFTLTSAISWTSMFVRKNIQVDINTMQIIILKYIRDYCAENKNLPNPMTLIQ